MSENKVMLETKAMEIMETTRSIHDDYEATLYNLATACYELSKEKANQGLFFTYRVETKENPYGIYLKGFEKDSVMDGGLGLFPECLIPELYPIRKVIESFSNKGKLEDITDGSQSAAGIMLLENYLLTIEVKTCNNTLEKYTIDRLE